MTYRDLISDLVPNNVAGASLSSLPVRDWAPLIKSTKLQGNKGNTFRFFAESGLNGWFTYVRFDQYQDQVSDPTVNPNEAARLLLWAGDLRLHCNCPSFSYHGYEYILTQYDAAIVPEDRFPSKNNPELKGWGCKHLRTTLKVLPFQLGPIASAIKNSRAGIDTNLPDEDDEV